MMQAFNKAVANEAKIKLNQHTKDSTKDSMII
jgi:hypothetical protein